VVNHYSRGILVVSDQFDGFAQMYEDMFDLPWRKYLESFSVLAELGDLHQRKVLDIGCGTGLYSRLLRSRGAEVVGYDISAGMIACARDREAAEPLGIDYVTEEPAARQGTFDLALAVYVLPFAERYADLLDLCGVAARALRPGGRLVALPVNPEHPDDRYFYERYGMRLFDAEPRRDGSKVTLELEFDSYRETVTGRYWSRPTLERALGEAGFGEVAWPGFRVSEQGRRAHSRNFWNPYLTTPHAALITCVKTEGTSC
jgi:toxoflavin synthase